MPIQPIGALPAVPSAGAGQMPWYGQLGGALAQAPQEISQQQAITAQNKAAAEEAPLAVERERAQAMEAQLKSDDQQLQRIVPALSQNPTLLGSPQVKATLEGMMKRKGIPLPLDAQGNIDLHALQSLSSTPMTAAGIQHVLEDVDKTVKLFEDSRSGMDPAQFGAAIKQKYDLLMKTGNIPEAESLLSFINPDGTPSDAYKQRSVSAKTQADIDNLTSLGVHRNDMDELHRQIETEHTREFNVTDARKKSEFGQRMNLDERKLAATIQASQARLADAQTRIQISEQNLNLAQDRFDQTHSMDVLNAYKNLIEQSNNQLNKWRDGLNSDVKTLQTMSTSQLAKPEGQALARQANDLKKLIDQNQQMLQARAAAAQVGLGQAASSVIGAPVMPVNKGDGTKKFADRAKVIEIGKQHGLSPAAAIKDAEAHGYTVQ